MSKRRRGVKPAEILTETDLTKDDWCALYMAWKLCEQIALYGHGRRTLVRFAKAILNTESEE